MKLGIGFLWFGQSATVFATRSSSCLVQDCGLLPSALHSLGSVLVPGPELLPALRAQFPTLVCVLYLLSPSVRCL